MDFIFCTGLQMVRWLAVAGVCKDGILLIIAFNQEEDCNL